MSVQILHLGRLHDLSTGKGGAVLVQGRKRVLPDILHGPSQPFECVPTVVTWGGCVLR